MSLFLGAVGLARQKTNNIFNCSSFILIIITVSIFLICSKNANAQSYEPKKDKEDTAQQVDLRKLLLKGFNVSLYRSQLSLLSRPFLSDTSKYVFNGRFPSKRNKMKDIGFLKEMNSMLDSVWKKF